MYILKTHPLQVPFLVPILPTPYLSRRGQIELEPLSDLSREGVGVDQATIDITQVYPRCCISDRRERIYDLLLILYDIHSNNPTQAIFPHSEVGVTYAVTVMRRKIVYLDRSAETFGNH